MSALGQKQTLTRLFHMSALPPKADIRQHVTSSICGGVKAKGYDSLNELRFHLVCGPHNARQHRCPSVRILRLSR
jgi:hypothetical protein